MTGDDPSDVGKDTRRLRLTTDDWMAATASEVGLWSAYLCVPGIGGRYLR